VCVANPALPTGGWRDQTQRVTQISSLPDVLSTQVAVIGAGPAGLIAAETLSAAGLAVTVYDQMPSAGRKLLMAGRGGLNLTHTEPLPAFLKRYGTARRMLEPAIEAFPPKAGQDWCHGLGQPTFSGSSGRVFPTAMKASPLLRAWLRRLDTQGVRLATRHRWVGWAADGALRFETPDGEVTVDAAATVLALGGASWPRLGSDAAWTPLLGRWLAPFKPSNCGFTVDWTKVFRERFAGEPLKRIGLSGAGHAVRGEAMITAQGIEGGAVYALSAALRDAIAAQGSAVVHIDLRPDIELSALAERMAAPRKGQSLSSFLRKQAMLAPIGVGLVQEALHKGSTQDDLAGLIKALPVTLVAAAPIERAISSAGGIRLAALNLDYMIADQPGVFVAGEMLDWEAPTGGYLLQACLATGIAAARGTIAWLERERV